MADVLKAQREARREAAERYLAAFEAFASNGAAAAPQWLKTRRAEAIHRFAQRGFPSTREEAWRFTDIRPLVEEPFALAQPLRAEDADPVLWADVLVGDGPHHTAVFVNGFYSAEHSSTAGLPKGVKLGSLAAALETDHDLIQEHLARYAAGDTNPLTWLSTAFVRDGAFVYVAKDTVLDRPLELIFAAVPQGDVPQVWHPRTLIIIERGAQVSLVETYVGVGRTPYWTNAVTEVVVGENANVDAYRVQRESDAAFHTATTQSIQGRNSVFSCIAFTFGGQLTRHDLNAVLDGEGGEATLDGLTVVRGRQHVDYHTTLDHAKPHCNSWEFFNGIFDDRSRGVFNGRIMVRPGAQKTDSKQTNNNVLLSKHARADSQPQLEIYADDVKCTHGATLGPLDAAHVFYLQARGLDEKAARALLTYGFASEILSNVTHEPLRNQLDALVRRRLAESSIG